MAIKTIGGYSHKYVPGMETLIKSLPYSYHNKSGYGPTSITVDTVTKKLQVSHDIRYELEGSVKSVIEMLQKYARFDGAKIDIEPYDDYGSATVRATVEYWVTPTKDEKAIVAKLVKMQNDYDTNQQTRILEQQEKQAVENLKKLGYKVCKIPEGEV